MFFPDTDEEAEARFPLIVLAHGLTGSPSRHADLAEAWARAGFVVALPAFPLTNSTVPGGWSNYADVNNQPGDVSFVIDQLVAADDDPLSALHARIDPERIGLAGHSLGAATTYAATFDACCRDPRIDAAVVMAGVLLVQADRHGLLDRHSGARVPRRCRPAPALPGRRRHLRRGCHRPSGSSPCTAPATHRHMRTPRALGRRGRDDQHRLLARPARRRRRRLARLEADATVTGLSSIQSDPG